MRIHFIAIGGAAMHNLAIALQKNGHQVSGSDDIIFDPSKTKLEKAGLLPKDWGWYPEKITSDLDCIILGMHAKKDNPELLKAQDLGIKIYSYPEFIYEQSKNKTRVVIGGSHGKTTITSMILHTLHYHNREVDYMVGAQLEGFDTMVRLTDDAEFIILEGDEYLSSPIDLRPKFHLYQPNIASISGIAWDHINVFPTEEIYNEQFRIFIDSITNGGILMYNEEDEVLKEMVEASENPIRKMPYHTPEYQVENGQTFLLTDEGEMPLEIFGKHNLNNLMGAKWICQHIGIDEEDFYEAIVSFKGASKRLQRIPTHNDSIIFKDFAHSPSKVKATVQSVKEQYPNQPLTACLELHTFSSLNPEFLEQYQSSMDAADQAIVFYDEEALRRKGNSDISEEKIKASFQHPNMKVFTQSKDIQEEIYNADWCQKVLLLMSSGNYAGIDFEKLK